MQRLSATLRALKIALPLPAAVFMAMSIAIALSTSASAAPVTIGGPFTLTTPDRTTVTDKTFRGKWLLVFFGYTFCPDVCPTTLMEIARSLERLGAEAANVQPIFVTTDPQRDTPEVMGAYTGAFDERILGLSGTREQIAAISEAYGAYSEQRKIGPGEGDYVVEHTTYIYIMGPDGQFVRGLDHDAPGEEIADALRKLMERAKDAGDDAS